MSTFMPQQVACNATERIVTFIATLNKGKQKLKLLGDWIKGQRLISGLSQEGAANKAGISRYQWIRIENGQYGTKRSTIIHMAEAIGGNVSEALRLAGYASSDDYEIVSINFDFEGVSEKDIEKVNYLKDLLENEIKKLGKIAVIGDKRGSSSAADSLAANPEFEKKKSRAKNSATQIKK